jgi:L-gulonolactone oxidase
MSCLGSISDQTLAGAITTATHGSGLHFGVIPTWVISLSLLLADGSRQTCSRKENEDLFMASLCGLGATGIILTVELQVEPAFRLKEVNQNLSFHDVVMRLDEHVQKAEHTKFWWYPAKDIIRASYYNRTLEARHLSVLSPISYSSFGVSPRSLLAAGCGTPCLDFMSSNFYYSSPDISSL